MPTHSLHLFQKHFATQADIIVLCMAISSAFNQEIKANYQITKVQIAMHLMTVTLPITVTHVSII